MDDTTRADILALLGLDPEADDAAVLAAIRALVEKPEEAAQAARPDPTKWGAAHRRLQRRRRGEQDAPRLSRSRPRRRGGEGRSRDARLLRMKDWAVELCTSNLPACREIHGRRRPGLATLLGRTLATAPDLQVEGASG